MFIMQLFVMQFVSLGIILIPAIEPKSKEAYLVFEYFESIDVDNQRRSRYDGLRDTADNSHPSVLR